ncbi:MAG: hypothetical protein QMC77_03230 [Methanocellales archaeon]|nr:hypothetical protein [Methanocellales archaeon]
MGYKCKCGGELRKSHTEVEFYGIDFGVRECEVCSSCGTEYLSEDIIEEMEEEIKNRGIFALERAVKITKSGNSLVLRLPPEIVKFLEIHHKSTVRLFPADKHRLEVEVLG